MFTATYLINHFPCKTLQFLSPLCCLSQEFPSIWLLDSFRTKILGCIVFVHNPNPTREKLDSKAYKCIFLGYSPTLKSISATTLLPGDSTFPMIPYFWKINPFPPCFSLGGELNRRSSIHLSLFRFLITYPRISLSNNLKLISKW